MKWFADLSIQSKLRLAFTVMLLIVATLGVISLYTLTRLDKMVLELQQEWLPRVKYSATMTREMTGFRALEFQHIMAPTKEEKAALESQMEELHSKYNALHLKVVPLIPPGDNPPRKFFTTSDDAIKIYLAIHAQALELSSQNKTEEARVLLAKGVGLEKLAPRFFKWVASC